ncbi:hypothetical protein RHOER0001_3632 [Rhodococcus erythropolis SK121]|nr:hypothetical protein RHOER0001_3632 [Rhodococcus erythropolis SK121]
MSTEDDSTTVIEFLHGGAPAPVVPNNVVESMIAGIPVPALPGIEDLFAPLIELGKSLGTGTLRASIPSASSIRRPLSSTTPWDCPEARSPR